MINRPLKPAQFKAAFTPLQAALTTLVTSLKDKNGKHNECLLTVNQCLRKMWDALDGATPPPHLLVSIIYIGYHILSLLKDTNPPTHQDARCDSVKLMLPYLRHVNKADASISQVNFLANCIDTLMDSNQLQDAKHYLEILNAITGHIANPYEKNLAIMHYHSRMGLVSSRTSRFGNAIKHMASIEVIGEQHGDLVFLEFMRTTLIKNYLQIGHMLLKKEKLDDALDWYELAQDMALQLIKSFEGKTPQTIRNHLWDPVAGMKKSATILASVNLFIESTKKKLIAARYSQFERLVKLQGLTIGLMPPTNQSRLTLVFNDAAPCAHMQKVLDASKIAFTTAEKSVCLDLLEVHPRHYGKLLERFNTHGLPARNITTEIVTPLLPPSSTPDEKQEKLKRHEESVLSRQTAEQRVEPVESETPRATPGQLKLIRWNHPHYLPLAYQDTMTDFYRVNGRPELMTISTFSQNVFDTVPTQAIIDKARDVAKFGRVIRSEKSQGSQGYVFFKSDKKLKKYGEQYVCKLKLLGIYGDHRFLGEKVAAGKLIVNGEETATNCELIEFNRYVRKAH